MASDKFGQMVANRSQWSLASDLDLLEKLKGFSDDLFAKSDTLTKQLDDLDYETRRNATKVDNVVNDLQVLANSQFIESRVYDEEQEDLIVEAAADASGAAVGELDTISQIREALVVGMNTMKQLNLSQLKSKLRQYGSGSESDESDENEIAAEAARPVASSMIESRDEVMEVYGHEVPATVTIATTDPLEHSGSDDDLFKPPMANVSVKFSPGKPLHVESEEEEVEEIIPQKNHRPSIIQSNIPAQPIDNESDSDDGGLFNFKPKPAAPVPVQPNVMPTEKPEPKAEPVAVKPKTKGLFSSESDSEGDIFDTNKTRSSTVRERSNTGNVANAEPPAIVPKAPNFIGELQSRLKLNFDSDSESDEALDTGTRDVKNKPEPNHESSNEIKAAEPKADEPTTSSQPKEADTHNETANVNRTVQKPGPTPNLISQLKSRMNHFDSDSESDEADLFKPVKAERKEVPVKAPVEKVNKPNVEPVKKVEPPAVKKAAKLLDSDSDDDLFKPISASSASVPNKKAEPKRATTSIAEPKPLNNGNGPVTDLFKPAMATTQNHTEPLEQSGSDDDLFKPTKANVPVNLPPATAAKKLLIESEEDEEVITQKARPSIVQNNFTKPSVVKESDSDEDGLFKMPTPSASKSSVPAQPKVVADITEKLEPKVVPDITEKPEPKAEPIVEKPKAKVLFSSESDSENDIFTLKKEKSTKVKEKSEPSQKPSLAPSIKAAPKAMPNLMSELKSRLKQFDSETESESEETISTPPSQDVENKTPLSNHEIKEEQPETEEPATSSRLEEDDTHNESEGAKKTVQKPGPMPNLISQLKSRINHINSDSESDDTDLFKPVKKDKKEVPVKAPVEKPIEAVVETAKKVEPPPAIKKITAKLLESDSDDDLFKPTNASVSVPRKKTEPKRAEETSTASNSTAPASLLNNSNVKSRPKGIANRRPPTRRPGLTVEPNNATVTNTAEPSQQPTEAEPEPKSTATFTDPLSDL